ncbi:MAG: hypothetical protein U0T84_02625 [Chitinophagales bacterium]
MNKAGIFFLFGLLLFVGGCKKVPNDGVPFYLEVDSLSVTIDNPLIQGSSSSKLTDIWLEAGNTELGAFECPVRVPILREGNVPLLISPGIKNNGAAGYRKIYPFLIPDTFTLTAQRGQVYVHHPHFRYKAGTKFHNEDFEGAVNTYTNITPETSSVFEGSKSGLLSLSANDTFKISYLNTAVAIPGGGDVYLEMNYKCDVPFTMGITANSGSGPQTIDKITFGAKSFWNKTYIDLSYEVGQTASPTATTYYQVYFYVAKNPGFATNVYFDNIKLLHY